MGQDKVLNIRLFCDLTNFTNIGMRFYEVIKF